MAGKHSLILKRLFDLAVSFSGLLILFPVFIILGVIIVVDDRGPVFFKQKRIGRGGAPFYMYKFRTIRVSEPLKDGLFGPGNLSDVTRFGKFLRRTKLNEFPQLINVMKGEMSIVGPRPEVERWVAVYPERWARVLRVKPGITDKVSVSYWNEEYELSNSDDQEKTYREIILPKKLDMYERYIENNSFSGDLRLIFETLSSFLFRNDFLGNKTGRK
jgi:lipopolysaccharide/colanic/teichoic acid biosynthesis glycosyltransferase